MNQRAAVERVSATDLYAIRYEVLRVGTPSDDVGFGLDDDPTAVHLAIRDDVGTIVGAASWAEVESPDRPGERALQLRGMAVADSQRGKGLGVALIAAGAELAVARDIALLWANARDSALAFYRAAGFDTVGEGFVTTDTKLPHHRILRRL